MRLPALTLLGLAALVVTGALAIRAISIPTGGTSSPTLLDPPDGTVVVPADSAGAISREAAIAAAGPIVDTPGARVEAYLVRMTDPRLPDMTDRRIWLIEIRGISVPAYGPPIPHTPTLYTTAWVYVDAVTGEWLVEVEQQDP
jgi:hypothetical protein